MEVGGGIYGPSNLGIGTLLLLLILDVKILTAGEFNFKSRHYLVRIPWMSKL
jgi:hypothetical protein